MRLVDHNTGIGLSTIQDTAKVTSRDQYFMVHLDGCYAGNYKELRVGESVVFDNQTGRTRRANAGGWYYTASQRYLELLKCRKFSSSFA